MASITDHQNKVTVHQWRIWGGGGGVRGLELPLSSGKISVQLGPQLLK